MNAFLLAAGLGLGLTLVSCTSAPETPVAPVAAATGNAPAASAPPASAKPAATTPVPTTAAAAAPSLKESQKLDRELGDAVIPYPFDNCAVIQKPFDREGPKHRRVYKGYEVLFCCTPCVRAFDTNPEPYMPRIMAAAKDRAAGTVTPPVVSQ
jgi:YHS domain-containing protein